MSHLAHAAAIRVSTNANRIRVWATIAWQSATVRPGDTGTAIQPARMAPRYAATQKKEFSATMPTHSPCPAPFRSRNAATDETAPESWP